MDINLLNILACPLCKGKLKYEATNNRLVCKFDKLAYPIRDGIPVMLPDQATKISQEELS